MDDHTVLGRSLAILDVVAASDAPISLAALTRGCGMPKPTVRRLAGTLCVTGMLSRAQEGFVLGPRSVAYAGAGSLQHRYADGLPILQEIQRTTGAVCWLVLVSGEEIAIAEVYAAASRARWHGEAARLARRPGFALHSAVGRLRLAEDPVRASELIRPGFVRMTPRSESRTTRLREAVARSAELGWCVEHEQAALGWSCAAVPVHDPAGGLVGFVGATQNTSGFHETVLVPRLVTLARDLGSSWPQPA